MPDADLNAASRVASNGRRHPVIQLAHITRSRRRGLVGARRAARPGRAMILGPGSSAMFRRRVHLASSRSKARCRNGTQAVTGSAVAGAAGFQRLRCVRAGQNCLVYEK